VLTRSKTASLAVILFLLACPEISKAQSQGIYAEALLRQRIIYSQQPEFPREALEAGAQGTVIVAVVFDEEGNLSKAEVMESPHPAIKQAVLDALKQWKSGRYGGNGGPWKLTGWLSFSCVIEDGRGQIVYTQRTDADNKPDKRYRHPFAQTHERFPFYYRYQFGHPR
jgi:TonB family protein